MSKLLHDWQFWVVTCFAALALLWMLRNVLPAKVSPFARRTKGRAATLTVGGRPVGKKPQSPKGKSEK